MRRLAFLVFFALPVFANITSSSLTGRVIVADAPASGVTVTASSTALQHPRATLTNANGRYWLGALPPGTYDVTFSLEGHTTLTMRAVLELGRVARADAKLEANPDEDSVTSTATQLTVADTIAITTHFDDRMLDRMPDGRIATAAIAPGTHLALPVLDGVADAYETGEETIEQITAIRGAAPVEWETFAGTALAARTKSGGEDFFFTLRDTITDDAKDHFGEATAGGRIVPERLWFFAGAWRGELSAPFEEERNGMMVKLDAQIGASHHVDAIYHDSEFAQSETDIASIRYTAAIGPWLTTEVVAGRTDVETLDVVDSTASDISGRASYFFAGHLLTAGVTSREREYDGDSRSLFAGDRWSFSRWNVYAGVRYDDGQTEERLSPRVAITYDVLGDGRHAISASWGESAIEAEPQFALRTATLGYAIAIGNSGAARADIVRRESGGWWLNELQLDARYRMFDRFEAGGTYTYIDQRDDEPQPFFRDHDAHVWVGAEFPIGAHSHEFGATLLQNYVEYFYGSASTTDVALRYTIPFSRLGLTLAADVLNLFDGGALPRDYRFWIRARL